MTEQEGLASDWKQYQMRIAAEHPTWSGRQIDRAARELANREGAGADKLEAAFKEVRKGKSEPAMVRLKWAVIAVLIMWFITARGGCTYNEDAEITHRF
jgi:hypothetical protein